MGSRFNRVATRNVGKKKPLPRGPVYRHSYTTPTALGVAAYGASRVRGANFKTSVGIGAGVYAGRTAQKVASNALGRHRANARNTARGRTAAGLRSGQPLSAAQRTQRRNAARSRRR